MRPQHGAFKSGDMLLRLITRVWMPPGRAPCPRGHAKKGHQKGQTGLAEAGPHGGERRALGLQHLPRGRALRGDRGLRENRRGPETEKERRVQASAKAAFTAQRSCVTAASPPTTPRTFGESWDRSAPHGRGASLNIVPSESHNKLDAGSRARPLALQRPHVPFLSSRLEPGL